MKSKEIEFSLRKLSLSVGDFIRYWGFRRIHGSIWTQLFLSQQPLSCTDLARRLKVSKALISPALTELQTWKLIHQVDSSNDKTILYEAEHDVNSVIRHVLTTREKKMLNQIVSNFDDFNKQKNRESIVREDRLAELQLMIFSADMMLNLMIQEKEILDLPTKFERTES